MRSLYPVYLNIKFSSSRKAFFECFRVKNGKYTVEGLQSGGIINTNFHFFENMPDLSCIFLQQQRTQNDNFLLRNIFFKWKSIVKLMNISCIYYISLLLLFFDDTHIFCELNCELLLLYNGFTIYYFNIVYCFNNTLLSKGFYETIILVF